MRKALHLLFLSIFFTSTFSKIPTIPPHENCLKFIRKNGFLMNNLKLHLGCGESHLNGYINIDFPLSEHPLQNISGADLYADITQLSFPQRSIFEVRSHHTFEHFNRQTALALVAAWTYWLSDNGILTIETPDFGEAIKQLLSPSYTYVQKQIIVRHIFGSHEANWATHYDGWSKEKYEHILPKLGLTITSVEQKQYMVLKNITVRAQKIHSLSKASLVQACHEILAESLTDQSQSERALHALWCSEFDHAFKKLVSEDRA